MTGIFKNKPLIALFAFLVVIVAASLALAQVQEPVAPKLTPKLQALLRQEMVAIHDASQEILTALVSGNDARVETLAQQIHDSFILRQSITVEDKQSLMATAPGAFVQMDREFHEISAELAQAAGAGNRQLQHEFFGRMIEACSACHARFATNRFPSFAKVGSADIRRRDLPLRVLISLI